MRTLTYIAAVVCLSLGLISCDTSSQKVPNPTADNSEKLENNNHIAAPAEDLHATESQTTTLIETVQYIKTEEFIKLVSDLDNPKGFQYKGKMPALVDLYADWCGPCRQISPYLIDFAKKYAGKIVIYKVNIDKSPEVAQALGVNSIPTLLFFYPNKQPIKYVGAPTKDDLGKMIQDNLLKE